jgi:hypothetical protein
LIFIAQNLNLKSQENNSAMAASNNIQQRQLASSHSLYPIDELGESEPLLSTINSIQAKQQQPPNNKPPTLFTVKDHLKNTHYVISMDAELGRWKTQSGTTIDPQTDSLGYQYYQIHKDFMDCHRDIQLRGVSNPENMALGFMTYRQLDRANDRLGCIQFLLISLLLIFLAGIIVTAVYAVRNHMF